MQIFLVITLALAAVYAQEHEHSHLPEVLIHRAREIIARAEQDLHRHHFEGRHHLTKHLEEEIEKVRHLERELVAMEQHKHMETKHFHEVEEKLLHHENKLAEELALIEEHHKREQEGHGTTRFAHELIAKAHGLIERAEKDLHRHHAEGRHHLTHALVQEIDAVRHLVRELEALVSHQQHRHMEEHHFREVEQRLAAHEARLAHELQVIEENHKREQEGHLIEH